MEEENSQTSVENSNTPNKKNIRIKPIHVFVLLFVLSLGLNLFLFLKLNPIINGNVISGENFKLVKPLDNQPIDSNSQSGNAIIQYQNLKDIIKEDINNYNATENVGFFLQDTKTGAWLGINEKGGFYPASLLKIPIMMAVLNKVQNGEISMDDTITLTQDDLDSKYGNLYQKGIGAKISVSELLKEMVSYSDNTAKNALKRQLSASELDSVFVHLGISDPYLKGNNQTVSPREYMRLFKSLYYSTFLSAYYSEIALELTIDKEYNLISERVPSNVVVAHKFGIIENEGVLHDCGIVYHQNNPYFLCIMTKDLDLSKSVKLIPKLSKDVYEFVDKASN